ncbi:MAG: 50S ribosomal protein L29 [Myxococcota bacterium]
MQASELRDLSENELEQKGKELRDELFNAKIRRATEQLENTALLGQLKKDIARVETLLTEKRAAVGTSGQGA